MPKTLSIANLRESLQGMFNQLYKFSNDWSIGVFRLMIKSVKVGNCVNYLGINLNFNVTQKTILMQGWKCMFGILKV